MPKRQTIKLQTNVPLLGTVSKAYFSYSEKAKAEGWEPQLKLVGTWVPEGEGDVYLPLRLVEPMENKGFLRVETGPEHDLYHVMMPNSTISLVKEEDGTKKFIRFSIVDRIRDAEVDPRAAEPTQEGKDSLKDVVGTVTRFHLGCMALSAHNHVLLYTAPTESLDMNAVHAGAYTISAWLEAKGVHDFTEKQLKSIRDTLSDASFEARKTSDFSDFPSAVAGEIEEQP